MLLVLRVPVRAIMDIMGWPEASMASRYMHTGEDERTELTNDQKAAIRLIAQTLPLYWRRRIERLLDDGEGPAAVPA